MWLMIIKKVKYKNFKEHEMWGGRENGLREQEEDKACKYLIKIKQKEIYDRNFLIIYFFNCMCIGVRVSDPLELEL